MCKCLNKMVVVVVVVILCFMQNLYIVAGYEHFIGNQQGYTPHCQQIEPNDAGNHEPYYMYKSPEFAPKLQNLLTGNFANYNHQQTPGASPDTLQFENYNQQTNEGSFHDNIRGNIPLHYSPTAANLEQHYPVLSMPTSSDFPPYNPSSSHYFSQNNDENKADNRNNNAQHFPTEALQHNMNSEQFNALLEDEVVGTPNLAFSHDEMLPIQNMYSNPNLELPAISEGSHIPLEYLHDPILRTFYSLDAANAAANIEDPHFPPATQQNNPVLKEPSIAVGNIHDYSNSVIPNYFPSIESTGQMTLNNRCNCPLTYRPIFIAMPWSSSAFNDLLGSMQFASDRFGGKTKEFAEYKGHVQKQPNRDYDENVSSQRSQSRDNNNNTSMENSADKNSSTLPDITTNSSPPAIRSTKIPENSEEELFVEDVTTKANNENSPDGTQIDKKDEFKASTTSVPQTTIRTFKTMMNAAKMHSMLANTEHEKSHLIQQMQNKRHTENNDSGSTSNSNLKKQYVRKLDKDYN